MAQAHRAEFAIGLLLTLMAGWVDAVGFLHFQRLFVSFMSGNSTQAAVHLAQGRLWEAARTAGAVGVFVVGAALGRVVKLRGGRRGRAWVLALTAALLALALAVQAVGELAAATPVILAMGAQNDAIQEVDRVKLGVTYVTGTLVSLGRGLGDRLCGRPTPVGGFALLWAVLAAGGLGGALAHAVVGLWALAPAAGLAGLLAAVTGGLVRRARPRKPTA